MTAAHEGPPGWATGPLLGFDTETTGVLARADRIVAAALVDREADLTRTTTWLLDPGVEIPAPASAVHGITTEHVRTHGRPPAEALAEIAGRIADGLRRGVPVVAFNARFDLALLDAELARHGLATLTERLGHRPRPVLDPLVLDRALRPDAEGARRLVDVCAAYGVRPAGELHAADVDARATLDLLAAIAREHPALAAQPAEQVHVWQATTERARRARRGR
jgi:DNA polymerase-3 subunit epsilon